MEVDTSTMPVGPSKLEIRWKSAETDRPSMQFATALASLLWDCTDEIRVRGWDDTEFSDLELDECVALLRKDTAAELIFELSLAHSNFGTQWVIRFSRSADGGGLQHDRAEIQIDLERSDWGVRSDRRRFFDMAWLQSQFQFKSPLPIMALPFDREGLTPEAFHGLVGLAARCGDLETATLRGCTASDVTTAQWHAEQPEGSNDKLVLPVVGLNSETLWLPQETPEADATSIWLEIPAETIEADRGKPTATQIRAALQTIFEQERVDFAALNKELPVLFPDAMPVRFAALDEVPFPEFMSHPQHGIVCVLAPQTTSIRVGLDITQDSTLLVDAVLHAVGHVLLGHVRVADEYGHWDTVETIRLAGTARSWDRLVGESFPNWFRKPGERNVQSLEECTPHEKACLGVWRMIGEMLGESRRLHPKAERYQPAAYQRQAAQRILAQLLDYDGAMLCDGVGLGKTYVATTLMVHFANDWRERFRENPDGLIDDPIRITILAPNSVVSTWRREALPPLGAFGVPLATIRVISHTKLSRVTAVSEVLARPKRNELSDLEHLLLSDLVIVDEAHNFRSINATRTKVLRDLLRVQPRKDQRRRVLLLTATPINNSLEDLRQEVSLLFSRPIWLSDAKTDTAYRRQAVQEITKRCEKARNPRSKSDVCAQIIHGTPDTKFSESLDFRDDLDFGPSVQRIGAYLREQDEKLKQLQQEIRAEAQVQAKPDSQRAPVRIADELLDRIVVQRSRALCKEIEQQQGTNVELLFRPDADAPERLYYSDEYDGIKDVLAGFLPLFETGHVNEGDLDTDAAARPLSFKVYMWYDVREGIKGPEETSSVVGLQRVLVLKRLESSPVSFLITLLRLAVLHAHQLEQLRKLCRDAHDPERREKLDLEIASLIDSVDRKALDRVRTLATGDRVRDPSDGFTKRLSDAHSSRSVVSTDDSPQLTLFERDEEEALEKETQLQRLWPLREWLLRDFETLLNVTPRLADIVFGKFSRKEWPHNFIAGGEQVDWPASGKWGMRVATDAKVRRLVSRLIEARRENQKVIVFSQFSDTLAYIHSVLRACREFSHAEWDVVIDALGVPDLQVEEVQRLLDVTKVITGDTEDRDEVVNGFAPYYRIGPLPPVTDGDTPLEKQKILADWEGAWRNALYEPVDILLSTDVLAEGVNLQDAAALINFDIHWNPVRMIQRAGRIDRRLNPRVEKNECFAALNTIGEQIGCEVPKYYWHGRDRAAPLTVNMILPDELEAELLLRERIATKTLAIDFTLGLEQGTGAEADWMKDYKYQGVSSLNAFQKDRAIEQIASYHEKFARIFSERQILSEWLQDLNGWFQITCGTDAPLVARVSVCPCGTENAAFSRYLTPTILDQVPHWLWSEDRPNDSLLNFWMGIDGVTVPPVPSKQGLRWHADASRPVRPDDLLKASQLLEIEDTGVMERPGECFCDLQQGVAAVTAGRYSSDEDREELADAISSFFVIQMPTDENRTNESSRGVCT